YLNYLNMLENNSLSNYIVEITVWVNSCESCLEECFIWEMCREAGSV
ncbi:3550_t:CDS:1, partial [Racocetra persica]